MKHFSEDSSDDPSRGDDNTDDGNGHAWGEEWDDEWDATDDNESGGDQWDEEVELDADDDDFDDEDDLDDEDDFDANDDADAVSLPCPHCHKSVHEDVEWCPYCGMGITRDTSVLSGKPHWYVVLAIVGMIATALTLILLY